MSSDGYALSPSLAGLGSTAEQVVAAELPVKHLFKSNAFLPFELFLILSSQLKPEGVQALS